MGIGVNVVSWEEWGPHLAWVIASFSFQQWITSARGQPQLLFEADRLVI